MSLMQPTIRELFDTRQFQNCTTDSGWAVEKTYYEYLMEIQLGNRCTATWFGVEQGPARWGIYHDRFGNGRWHRLLPPKTEANIQSE